MEEWNIIKAYDYCYNVTDGTHDSPKQTEFGKYLITSKHIKDNRIDFESAYKISEDDYNKIITRSKVDQWDIIISMIGAYCGFCCIESSKQTDYAIKNVGLLKVGNELKCKWLYYYLTSPHGKQQLSKLRSGSSQPYISLGALRNLDIPVPNENTMSDIVSVLSSLDSKIELNRRINDNLEKQAQGLYKSWFIDFEPFKGGKFVDSELGEIPEGWRVGRLSDVGRIVGGSTPSKSHSEYYTTNGIPWLTPKDLSMTQAKFTSRGEIDITEIGYKSCSTKLLPRGSVLFSSRAPIGYISIALNEICTNQGFKSIVPNREIGTAFIFYYLKANTSKIESQASGSTFKEASGTLINSLSIIRPPLKVIHNFNEIMTPIFFQQEKNEGENEKLSKLRDTLLPKLMSGELKISDLNS